MHKEFASKALKRQITWKKYKLYSYEKIILGDGIDNTVRGYIGFICLEYKLVAFGNEYSGLIKDENFLD
jgi:hypothetical protein